MAAEEGVIQDPVSRSRPNAPDPSMFRAQFGEDRVLWKLFRGRRRGFFVEIGAYDGVSLSNTFLLEQMGWSGLLVEAIAPLCERAARARPRSLVIHSACSRPDAPERMTFTVAEGVPVLSYLKADEEHVERCKREGARLVKVEVPVNTLDRILLHVRAMGRSINPWREGEGWAIDLVTIDVEGGELDVLEGFDLARFRPAVLILENDRPSGQGLEPYLLQRNYRLMHRQVINDFYVRGDLAGGSEVLELEGLTPRPG